MMGAIFARRVRALCAALSLIGLAAAAATPASALEFWDGKIQVHGFYEARMQFGWRDFPSDQMFTTYGFLHVLNLEIEADIAPDGWGPFDLVAAFSRIEVKYECVYNRACYVPFPNRKTFGDRPRRVPQLYQDGSRTGMVGVGLITDVDLRKYTVVNKRQLAGGIYGSGPRQPDPASPPDNFVPSVFNNVNAALFGAAAGVDGIQGTKDDPGLQVFASPIYSECVGGVGKIKASNVKGRGNQTLLVNSSGCDPDRSNGNLRNIPNPFKNGERNPTVLPGDSGFRLELPFRPGPQHRINQRSPEWESQGIFRPSPGLRALGRSGELDDPQQTFSVDNLKWNHGASQYPFRELKELYVDVEMFDSRLWVRAGRQTIVWGKTELFRNQDQFNPVDLGLKPLSPLEETRIALWSARGIWSFYEVGPLEDVRLEVAAIFDRFVPNDLGTCGEPWVTATACNVGFGLWVHGLQGSGVAGEVRPPSAWNSWEGIEVGARVEFRYDRFSFAISDFYGYTDTPHLELISQFERNVDPKSGRLREVNSRGRCRNGSEDACLTPTEWEEKNPYNQQVFDWICANTVGVAFAALDIPNCAQDLFNAQDTAAIGAPLALGFSNALAGQSAPGLLGFGFANGATFFAGFRGHDAEDAAPPEQPRAVRRAQLLPALRQRRRPAVGALSAPVRAACGKPGRGAGWLGDAARVPERGPGRHDSDRWAGRGRIVLSQRVERFHHARAAGAPRLRPVLPDGLRQRRHRPVELRGLRPHPVLARLRRYRERWE